MKCPKCRQVGMFGGFFINNFGKIGVQFYCPICKGRYVKVPIPYVTATGKLKAGAAHADICEDSYGA